MLVIINLAENRWCGLTRGSWTQIRTSAMESQPLVLEQLQCSSWDTSWEIKDDGCHHPGELSEGPPSQRHYILPSGASREGQRTLQLSRAEVTHAHHAEPNEKEIAGDEKEEGCNCPTPRRSIHC